MVNQGQTSYERSFDRPYTGKVCMFAEVVMAYVKTDKKGLVVALFVQGLFDG